VRDVGGMLAFRTVSKATIAFGEEFLYNSRPALRAAACGGRPRPAAQLTARQACLCCVAQKYMLPVATPATFFPSQVNGG
jgi:hypothetical protein